MVDGTSTGSYLAISRGGPNSSAYSQPIRVDMCVHVQSISEDPDLLFPALGFSQTEDMELYSSTCT